ncbi:MAG: 3-isopropylmalate dehydratase small subunit [Ignavibacteriae bacterium]|nr:MAG: 3-isopropylmalate dehydratase small subunit [Ignavibacteriota bacterium]
MKIWRYGDNINTDMLFPGKYTYTCSKPEEIKPHLLEDLDPEFSKNVQPGDILIVGKNFGCGSSREQPAVGLKYIGIEAIIGESFSRIFYRSAINQGLILIECPKAVQEYQDGMTVKIDFDKSQIFIDKNSFSFPKLPPEILAIRDAGGLLEYTRKKLQERGK